MAGTTYLEAGRQALAAAMRADPAVWCLGEDLGRGGVFGQYRGLQAEFGPERVCDAPISEAAIMGAGVGAAMMGTRPVVEMRFSDFGLCATDELVNQAAKARFMFGGQARVPMVVRQPVGMWRSSAAQHSQSLEAWYAHVPGLVVVCPATPRDNRDLLAASIACDDPVVYLEHKNLWGLEGEMEGEARGAPEGKAGNAPGGAPGGEVEGAPDGGAGGEARGAPGGEAGEPGPEPARLGRARVARSGSDVTVVSWSATVHAALEAAEALAAEGVSAEVIDLRTLWPWDREAVLGSAARTGRLLVAHEAVRVGGFGAEIAATAAEELGVPVRRLGAPRAPIAYAPNLENRLRVTAEAIAAAVRGWGDRR